MAKIATSTFQNGTKSASKNTAPLASNEQEQIAKLAYQYFLDRGCQDGFDHEDWLRAEAAVKNKKK